MTDNPHDAIGTPTIPLGVYRYAAAVLEANQIQQGERHGVAYELGWAAAIDFLQQREVPLTPDEMARILYTDHAGIQRLISSGDVFWPAAELKRANDLLSDAWGIIANAENFKHTLVCEHGHRCQDREGHTIDELTPEPIGPQVWRDAAAVWRDRWHAFMDAAYRAREQETAPQAEECDWRATCATCRQPIHYLDAPTGGWWAHDVHPADGHEAEPAVPGNGEQSAPVLTPGEGLCPRCGGRDGEHVFRSCVRGEQAAEASNDGQDTGTSGRAA